MARNTLKLAGESTRKLPEHVTLTKDYIDAVKAPANGRRFIYDRKAPGLALAVTAGGAKSFYLYRWSKKEGKPIKLNLGKWGDLTIANARDQVRELTGDMAKGIDPAKQRRERRRAQAEVQTFKGVYEHYRDHHLIPNCSPRTVQNDKYLFEAIPFRTKKLDSITTSDIKALHLKLCKSGDAWANKVILFVRRVVNYAIDELNFKGDNPVKVRQGRRRRRGGTRDGAAVSLAPERSRTRYLKRDEAPRFFRELENEPDEELRHLVYLLIYTGARRGNVQAMRWSQIDLDAGAWTIPADEAKAKQEIIVAMSSYAVDILRKRREQAPADAVFVFPSKRAKSGHAMEPKKAWWEFRKRANVPDLTLHDLRRTLATWLRTAGGNLETIGAALGHRSIAATQVYARADLDPVRQSVSNATRQLIQASKIGMKLADVVDNRKGGK